MTIEEAFQEKGLAVTQIELWQQRLKKANEIIISKMNEENTKPKIVGVEDAKPD